MDKACRSRFLAILDDFVANKFQTALSMFGAAPSSDPEGALKAISFWQPDLTTIRDRMALCFPPDFCIMDFYVLLYHRHVHGLIGNIISTRLAPSDILSILSWTSAYYSVMLQEFGASSDDLEPRLLDGRESHLISDYVSSSKQKLGDWIGNLFENERKNFCERTVPPELDPSNHFYSPAAVDLIQIMKQHISNAAEASKGKLVADIIGEVCKSVSQFQSNTTKMLEGERVKYLERPEEAASGFENYVIMLGNTSLRWATSLQMELVQPLEEMISVEFLNSSTKLLKDLGDGFVSIAKACAGVLVDVIFSAIKPAIQKLFTSAWYTDELVSQILATFADFLDDFRERCDEFLFNKLVADVLDRLLLAYLEMMNHKTTKLKMQECPGLFQQDVASIYAYFCQVRDEKRVKRSVDALDKLISLVVSSRKMVFLEFFAFWKVYPDIPLSFLDDVLSRRDDLDKQAIKEIMETCRKKTQEEKVHEQAPSIFSKLKS